MRPTDPALVSLLQLIYEERLQCWSSQILRVPFHPLSALDGTQKLVDNPLLLKSRLSFDISSVLAVERSSLQHASWGIWMF